MEQITSVFSSFGGWKNVLVILIYFVLFIVFAGMITTAIIFLLVKSKSTRVIQIDMNTRRLAMFNGRVKKSKGKKLKNFFASKIGRLLPAFQQKDTYIKGVISF